LVTDFGNAILVTVSIHSSFPAHSKYAYYTCALRCTSVEYTYPRLLWDKIYEFHDCRKPVCHNHEYFSELEHLLVERQRMVSEVISEYLISKIFLHDLATQFTTTQISWAEPWTHAIYPAFRNTHAMHLLASRLPSCILAFYVAAMFTGLL